LADCSSAQAVVINARLDVLNALDSGRESEPILLIWSRNGGDHAGVFGICLLPEQHRQVRRPERPAHAPGVPGVLARDPRPVPVGRDPAQ
jgi:hypothetical protein